MPICLNSVIDQAVDIHLRYRVGDGVSTGSSKQLKVSCGSVAGSRKETEAEAGWERPINRHWKALIGVDVGSGTDCTHHLVGARGT